MRKIFTLFVLLLLLPVTALAAEEIKLFIGGQQITESGCYENQNGTWTKVDGTEPANGQFSYDAATFTLTLNQAEITHDQTVKVAEGYTYEGSVIAFSQTADVSLKIVVSQGTSTITGTGGIRVESTTGDVSLSIAGPGSLDVEPKGSSSGITLCSSKDMNLDIDGADVTASSPAHYGVYLISSTDASSTSTITVNNGSLTTGGNGHVGIYYYWSDKNNAGTSSLTVSGNAVVDTRNSKIMTNNSETGVQVGAGSDGNGGIVFNGKNGTVYGDVELQEDITIGEGESLTIGDGASLDTNGKTITVESGGKLKGTIDGKQPPEITVSPVNQTVEEGSPAAFSVTASAGEGEQLTYQWQQKTTDSGSEWMDISDATNATYTTGQTTMAMSGYQYRCVVTASDISVISAPATLTVNAKPTYTITAVSSPAEGGTVTVNGGTSSVSVEANSTVNLVATPNAGYRFTGWTSSGGTIADASSVSTTFTMPANDVIVTAGFEQYYPVTSITLDKSELFLYTGNSETLTATIEPDNATNKNVTWSSDNEAVATVDNGKVTAVKEGTATITVTAQDGSGVSTSCSVTVTHSMVHTPKKDATCTEDGNIEYWYCKNCDKYFSDENATEELSDVVIPATGHHYVNGYCTKCGHRDPDYRPDPISYYNIYVEDVCDGVEVTLSNNVVREGNSISVYVKKDTANYTFDNFKVYYKRSYYGTWDELKEGTQPGEYPIKNIWNHIYIKALGAEEKEDPTGIESIEGVKVYTKDGSLYVQTPQREQVIIVSMSGAVVKNEEQVGLKQYHGLQPGIYIVRVGDRAYKLRLY